MSDSQPSKKPSNGPRRSLSVKIKAIFEEAKEEIKDIENNSKSIETSIETPPERVFSNKYENK